jgi:hypothetical protein
MLPFLHYRPHRFCLSDTRMAAIIRPGINCVLTIIYRLAPTGKIILIVHDHLQLGIREDKKKGCHQYQL